jgi:hypothetical protein
MVTNGFSTEIQLWIGVVVAVEKALNQLVSIQRPNTQTNTQELQQMAPTKGMQALKG